MNDSLKVLRRAFLSFKGANDEIFMYLVSRLITNVIQANPGISTKNEFDEYIEIIDYLESSSSLKSLDLERLFSNFEKRLELARQVERLS